MKMRRWKLAAAVGTTAAVGLLIGGVAGARPPSLPINDIDREPNDSFSDAVPVQPPLSHSTGCIAPASDVDFYRFTLGDNSPVLVGTRAKGAGQFALALYNSKQTKVASGTDSIDMPNADAGTYFLRVSSLEKDCYDLQIFVESRLPPFG